MTRNLILAAVAAVVLLLIALLGPAACQKIRSLTAQSKVDTAQSGAFRNSTVDTIDTLSNVSSNQAAGVEIGRKNEEDIRNAKGSDQRVDPAANAAGLRALCRRSSHRDDPACRVQQPNPK